MKAILIHLILCITLLPNYLTIDIKIDLHYRKNKGTNY